MRASNRRARCRVGDDILTADKVFINGGGRATVPALPGVGQVPLLTNTSLLELDELPRHLVVVGGSHVGLEFAQIYRRFGATVTVVEKRSRLIQREARTSRPPYRRSLKRNMSRSGWLPNAFASRPVARRSASALTARSVPRRSLNRTCCSP